MVRKMQIMKMRGQAPIPGLHTFRITSDGIQVFPGSSSAQRKSRPAVTGARARSNPEQRLSIGVKGLDEMLGGGIPAGYSVLLAGPSGSGKSVLATQFIVDGAVMNRASSRCSRSAPASTGARSKWTAVRRARCANAK